MKTKVGQRFGRLIVQKRIAGKNTKYLCVCDCGNTKVVQSSNLYFAGQTKSCGCLRKEATSKRFLFHGLGNHPLYKTWAAMKRRCGDESAINYKNYGGRGIRVSEEWSNVRSFIEDMYPSWLAHVDEHGKEQTTLERIDNDGNYTKENCTWATRHEQRMNCRVKTFI